VDLIGWFFWRILKDKKINCMLRHLKFKTSKLNLYNFLIKKGKQIKYEKVHLRYYKNSKKSNQSEYRTDALPDGNPTLSHCDADPMNVEKTVTLAWSSRGRELNNSL
jgi:hypothetical protein